MTVVALLAAAGAGLAPECAARRRAEGIAGRSISAAVRLALCQRNRRGAQEHSKGQKQTLKCHGLISTFCNRKPTIRSKNDNRAFWLHPARGTSRQLLQRDII